MKVILKGFKSSWKLIGRGFWSDVILSRFVRIGKITIEDYIKLKAKSEN